MIKPDEKQARILLHYHPWSRAAGVRWLLEELEVPYEVNFVDPHAPGGAPEEYRTIHPHKKVPAVEVDGQVITERAAIAIYLADRFSAGVLAPSLNDPLRASYLRMLVYNDAVLDPSVALHFREIDHQPSEYSFGAYQDTMRHLKTHLATHPFAAGSKFTAADTQLASSLGYTIHHLHAVPPEPEFLSYLARVADRPAHLRAQNLDAELMQTMSARHAG